jgi:tetratricopeptide (TPR) repeat protein
MANGKVVDEGLIALYEEASGALGEADSLLRARVLGQLAVELVYTPHRERRDTLTGEAVTIARRLGDRTGLAQVLILRLLAMNDPFTLAERLALTAELAALADDLGSSEFAWHAAFHRSSALLESGEIAGAEHALSEVERLAAELRQPFYAWFARMGRTMLSVMRGAADAEAQALSTFELGTAAEQPDATEIFAAELSNVRHNDGRVGEFVDAMKTFADANPHVPAARAVLARFYCDLDRHAEAREQIDLFRRDGFRPPLNWAWSGCMTPLSDAVCDVGDAAAASELYAALLPVAAQVDVFTLLTACGGSFARYCGMLAACLGRWDDAERHFADALAMDERLGARPFVVRTRRAWAAMLLDRHAPGDAARARDLIAAGRAEAEQLGMTRELVRFQRLTARMASGAIG